MSRKFKLFPALTRAGSGRWVFLFGCLLILGQLLKLDSIPAILYDEALYADTALQFLNSGKFQNNLGGFSGQQFIAYPFLLSGMFKCFGVSLWVGRFFSWACYFGSFLLMERILSRITSRVWIKNCGLGLFLISNLPLVSSRIIRPESLLITLYLWAIFIVVCLPKKDWIHACGLSLIFGLLCLTHLIGAMVLMVFVGRTLIDSLRLRNFKYVIIVLSVLALFFLVFLFNLISHYGSLAIFIADLQSSGKLGGASLLDTLYENSALFWSSYCLRFKRFLIVFFEFFVLFWAVLFAPKIYKRLAISMVAFLGVGITVIHLFLRPYYGLLAVLAIVLMVVMLDQVVSSKSKIFRIGFLLLLGGVALNSVLGSTYFIYRHRNNPSIEEFSYLLSSIDRSYPIVSVRQLWFLNPHLNWMVSTQFSPSDLKSIFGGYYVLAPTYTKESFRSSVSGDRTSVKTPHIDSGRRYFNRITSGTVPSKSSAIPYPGLGKLELFEMF